MLYPNGNTDETNADETIAGEAKAGIKSDKIEDSSKFKNVEIAFKECLNEFKKELDTQIYFAYLDSLKVVSFEDNIFTISTPSKLICKNVEENFGPKILSRLLNYLYVGEISSDNSKIELKFVVGEQSFQNDKKPYVVVKKLPVKKAEEVRPSASSSEEIRPPMDNLSFGMLPFGSKPNPKYTFSNFVVGNSNEFCHAAAMRVAENPGGSYNPLFIYGGVGLGKTHLMHAIGNEVLLNKPDARVLYMSSESFTNALIHSLRQAKMEEFKNLLRNIEVLLIDDIQFMRGKETTQEEFFHTFNALYSAKHQIVITSDKNPADIPGIEERLRTRFAWGLTADMQAPDFETRVAILKEKARIENFFLPEEVASFIAENFASNVRELEGALTRLHAVSSIQKIAISMELANSALKSLLQPKVVNVSVDDIKKAVSTHFNIKISDMVSKRRNKNLAFPRHIAMYLCRKHTTYSYPEIGAAFGGRDHSSIIHAANVITNKVQTNPEIKGVVDSIERKIFN